MNKLEVIAHRGNFLPEGPIPEVMDKYITPENTVESFNNAIINGWAIETDIRLTKDGNFICLHDGDIKRFSNDDGLIDQMDLNQIKGVTYKTNPRFKIPTLDELCQLGNGISIAFQIKRGHDLKSGLRVGEAIAQKIVQYNLKGCILFDATWEEAQILHQEFPWLNLSVSVGEKNYSPTIYTPDQALSNSFTSVFSSIWADEWKIPGSIYNKGLFEQFRLAYPKGRIDVISPELHYNEGHPLSKDTKGIKKLWKEIITWGNATGICTDYPTALQSIL